MKQKLGRLSAWMVPILFISLVPALSLYGTPQTGAEEASAGSKQSVTGCLQKGDEAGGFTVTGADGKVWELHSKSVQLADHVGHTVTVTGSTDKGSMTEEEKIEANEKKEAGDKEQGDLRVGTLKMVSDSCK